MELNLKDEKEDNADEVQELPEPKQFTFKKLAEGFSYVDEMLGCFVAQDATGDHSIGWS